MQRPPLPLPARPAPATANPGAQLTPKLLAAIECAAILQCLAAAEVEALNGPITREQFAQECMRTGASLLALEMPEPIAEDATRFHANRKAIHSLLQRIQRDPRLAHYFDPLTQSFEDLTAAHAINYRLDLQQFRKEFAGTLKYEAPQGRAA